MTSFFGGGGAALDQANTWDQDQRFSGKIRIGDGSIASPSLVFDGDPDTGVFKQASNVLGIVAGGVEIIRLSRRVNSINCFNLLPSIAGSGPEIEVAGADADIDMTLKPKGIGKIIIDSQIQINGGSPGAGKVLQSDADGLGTWTLPSGGGFTDAGATIILTNINDNVGIGTSSPSAKLDVGGTPGTSVGGFASGGMHLTNPSALINANSVLTGHNLNGGNKQLWYLGSVSSSNDDIAVINRQNGALSLHTNNIQRLLIEAGGAVKIGNLSLDGNILSTVSGDLDITTFTGGVFKFIDNALRAGLDAANYLEIGHGGSNSFVNSVGTGDMDFRFGGVNKATFTSFGHLHLLTDVDQKHNLKIKTANNANASGIAWENSGGNFSQTIFRDDIGGNRSDLVIAIGSDGNIDLLTSSFRVDGSVADLGNVEFFKKVGIGVTTPVESLEVNGNIKATTIVDITIKAQLSSSIDQDPADTNPVVITYNTQDVITGLTHSITVNPGEITIDTAGVYLVSPQPQVGKTSGATRVDFDMFLQVDRGSGFVDEPNSNIKLAIKDQDVTDVIVSIFSISLNVGDKIRLMQRITDSGVGMGLKNTDAEVGPPTIPRTPSIIFSMFRIGGI